MRLSSLGFYLLSACTSRLNRRIIDGRSTLTPSWMVYLKAGKFICGGVRYTESLVLTAAHCNELSDKKRKVYVNVKRVEPIIMGGEKYAVIKRINYEKVDNDNYVYDISVWWIDGKSNKFTQVELDDGTELSRVSKKVKVLGWGSINRITDDQILRQKYITKYPSKLKEVSLPLVKNSKCQKKFHTEFVPKTMFCMGRGRLGPGTSLGDSGGPVFRVKQNKIILVGLISFGLYMNNGGAFDVSVKISEPKISKFINFYVPYFKPENIDNNGNPIIAFPPHT